MKWNYNLLVQQVNQGDGRLAGVIPWGQLHVAMVFKRPRDWKAE